MNKIALCILVALSFGCASAQLKPAAPEPTELPPVYNSAMTVWLWAHARTTAERDSAADLALIAIRDVAEQLHEQCGEHWRECGFAAFESILEEWDKDNDYLARTESLGYARQLIEAWRVSILRDQPDRTRAASKVANALVVIVEGLRARGTKVPPELEAILRKLSVYAHERGISKAPPPAYGNSVVKS